MWSARTTGKLFLAPLTKRPLESGFLLIPSAYTDLFPKGDASQSIECVLQGRPNPEVLTYSPKHGRIAGGLTHWYQEVRAKEGGKVRVEVLVPDKKYKLTLASPGLEQARIVEIFESSGLHRTIGQASHDLFRDGHYAQAIREGYVAMNGFIAQRCGKNVQLEGTPLMEAAFATKKPVLSINKGKTQYEKDEREGLHGIARGAMLAVRNPLSHEKITVTDPYVALEYLSAASLLCKIAEVAKKSKQAKAQVTPPPGPSVPNPLGGGT